MIYNKKFNILFFRILLKFYKACSLCFVIVFLFNSCYFSSEENTKSDNKDNNIEETVSKPWLYGVTIDSVWGNLDEIVDAFNSHSKKPTVRIVFDPDSEVDAIEYQDAVNEIHEVAYIMGEILDSSAMDQYTVQEYKDRVNEYVGLYADKIDIWEIGNEVNGSWLGNDVPDKLTAAYNIVKAAGGATELTTYYTHPDWQDGNGDMNTWLAANIPYTLKQGLDYVLISYYPTDNGGEIFTEEEWTQIFIELAQIFPNSYIGFGEVGTENSADKENFINRYYNMNLPMDKFVGGFFWWYYYDDAIPKSKPLWTVIDNAWKQTP